MKVEVTRNYYDKELKEDKKKGDKFDVDDTRGNVLISAKVVKKVGRNQSQKKDKEDVAQDTATDDEK